MIGNAPKSHITQVPGWETPAEQELLVKLAQDVPENGVIVEIGAEYGMSASLFCHGAQQSVEIVSIDLFPGDLLEQHRLNLLEAGFRPLTPDRFTRSGQTQGDSAQLGQTWPETGYGEIDLLFIDGDHSYAGCKKDIEVWTPHIRIGGKVAFHDTAAPTNRLPHVQHYDVSRAIADWLAVEGDHWRLIEQVDSIQVYERTA